MGSKKPKNEKVRISMHGTNATDVTGSFTVVTYKDVSIAVDCGAFQGESKLKTYQINKSMFKDVNIKNISQMVLTHKNHDHIGSICMAFNQGCNAEIFMVEGSYPIVELMFKDSLKIGISDSNYLSKKYGKDYTPLFTENDVEKALHNIIEYRYHERFKINKYMSVEFIPAGHIYLSSQILLFVEDGNYKRKILFTGDIGSPNSNKPLVEKFEPVKSCNLVLGEVTYAMAENKSTPKHKKEDINKIKKQIDKTCYHKKGSLLFGAFALQRSLDILVDLYAIWEETQFHYEVILDSPLGVNILKSMEEYTKSNIIKKLTLWDNLRFIDKFEDSKEIMYSNTPRIIVTCGGYAQGGRILAYFTQFLPNKKNCLVTVGYCSDESNMGQVKKRKPIMIMNEGELNEYEVNCDILEIGSYSSHAQHEDLLNYYTSIQCDKIVLNHADNAKKYEFAELLCEKLSEECKTTKVFVMNRGEYITV